MDIDQFVDRLSGSERKELLAKLQEGRNWPCRSLPSPPGGSPGTSCPSGLNPTCG